MPHKAPSKLRRDKSRSKKRRQARRVVHGANCDKKCKMPSQKLFEGSLIFMKELFLMTMVSSLVFSLWVLISSGKCMPPRACSSPKKCLVPSKKGERLVLRLLRSVWRSSSGKIVSAQPRCSNCQLSVFIHPPDILRRASGPTRGDSMPNLFFSKKHP